MSRGRAREADPVAAPVAPPDVVHGEVVVVVEPGFVDVVAAPGVVVVVGWQGVVLDPVAEGAAICVGDSGWATM